MKKFLKKEKNKGFTPLETKDKKSGKNIKDKNKFLTGFTLIETFVAITILLIAIAGPLTLIVKGMSASKSAKERIIAMYLAQDAIEYIRNMRDENILNGDNWLKGLDGLAGAGDCMDNKCVVDTSDYRDVVTCEGALDPCPSLKFDPASKIYGYDNGNNSIFTREIEIDELTNDIEVEIIVTTSWQEKQNTWSFVIREHLMNWQ